MTRHLSKTVIAASLALIGTVAQAQTTDAGTTTGAVQETPSGTTPPPMTTASSVTPNGTAAGKLIARFTAFAGSEENAAGLVNGLRTGAEITLDGAGAGTSGTATGGTTDVTTTAGTTTGTTGTAGSATAPSSDSVTFTPPTRPMGYGNVKIALSLAEAQLAAEGITQPTPQQLQATLMGSTTTAASTTAAAATTQTQGVLQMRASGMGWGQIASSTGFKLGAVMSQRVPLETAAVAQAGSGSTGPAAAATTAAATGAGTSSGIVTAAGASSGRQSHGHLRKSGAIVTATGASMGHAHQGSRAITAAGGMGYGNIKGAASRTVSARGANHGNGSAYGHKK